MPGFQFVGTCDLDGIATIEEILSVLEIEAVLDEIRLPLLFIPFEAHRPHRLV